MSVTDPVTPPRATSTKALAAIVVLLAFVSGIVAGAVGDRLLLLHGFGRHQGRAITERMLKRLDSELALTPQQHEQVKQILETHRARIETIMTGVQPQVRHELEQGNEEIRAVLTPEQRVKYEKVRLHLLPLRRPMHGRQ